MMVAVGLEMLQWSVFIYFYIKRAPANDSLGIDWLLIFLFPLTAICSGWVHYKKSGLRRKKSFIGENLLDSDILTGRTKKSLHVAFIPRLGNFIFGVYNTFFLVLLIILLIGQYRNGNEMAIQQELLFWTNIGISLYVFAFVMIGGLVRHAKHGYEVQYTEGE